MSRRPGIDVSVRGVVGLHRGQVPAITAQVRAYWPIDAELDDVRATLREAYTQALVELGVRHAEARAERDELRRPRGERVAQVCEPCVDDDHARCLDPVRCSCAAYGHRWGR